MINRDDDIVITNYSGHQLGNYRLLYLLGRGGYASVYLAEHIYLKRQAAIKVLHTVLGESEKARFLIEAQMLAALSHSHIVRVLEFDVLQNLEPSDVSPITGRIPFLIMDYVQGGSLRARYPSGSSLALETVVNYIKQVAEPLHYAHERGIIHRDIKPENLLLTERQEVMLSDFGLALFAPTPEVLSLQEIVGSLPYSAPEQLRGKPHFASDQYSLAIIAYEWLCGQRPFQGEDIEVVMKHVSSPPPSLLEKMPTLPPAVEDVILRALAKEPQQRFPDIHAFAEALEQASQVQSFGFSDHIPVISNARPLVSSSYEFSQGDVDAHINRQEVSSVKAPLSNKFRTFAQSVDERPRENYTGLRNRWRMIRKVRSFWIDGVLKRSLHNTNLITLGLDEARGAVAQPWHLSLYQGEKHIQSLPPDTHITKVYDQMDGEILILGEGGSGKTTLLLQLARDLLDRAEQEDASPIPVIFPLSSWSERRLPLAQWFVDELNSNYQVPRALGELWVREERLVPLLDGLDEVVVNSRSACVAAINMYRKEHGFSPLVVCSRLREYMLNPQRVLLRSAIIIQPLTTEQVENYLLNAGGGLEAFYHRQRKDQLLQKLVTTPLMLSIIAVAYQGKVPDESLTLQLAGQQYQQLLRTYVEEILKRYGAAAYKPQEVVHWLSTLARHMQQRNQTIVYLEQIQPDWINQLLWRQIYRWLAVWLPGIGIGLLVEILSYTLLFEPGTVHPLLLDGLFGPMMGCLLGRRKASLSDAEEAWEMQEVPKQSILKGGDLLAGFLCGLLAWRLLGDRMDGIIYGVLSFLLSIMLTRFPKKRNTTIAALTGTEKKQNSSRRRYLLLEQVKAGMLVGIPYGLTVTVLTAIKFSSFIPMKDLLWYMSSIGLHEMLSNGLLGVLISLLLRKQDGTIRPAEMVTWSWKALWDGCRDQRNIFNSLLLGSTATLIYSFLVVFEYGPIQTIFQHGKYIGVLVSGLTNGLVIGTGAYLLAATSRAVASHNLADQERNKPNEGIWRSLRYGLLAGVAGACLSPLLYIWAVTPSVVVNALYHLDQFQKLVLYGWSVSLSWHDAIFIGFIGAILMLLLLGGLAFLQHSILRLILWRTNVMPLNAPHFLDQAVSSILLHKVGGGYMFIHHLLLNYFASLDEKQD